MGCGGSSPAAVESSPGFTSPKASEAKDNEGNGPKPSSIPEPDGQYWKDYIKRQRQQQKELVLLAKKTPRRAKLPLPSNLEYIRPFLSSTFRDFNDERDIMFKQNFPLIEKLCRDRGVDFLPLDLRWGVTKEESGSGKVIQICLKEVDQSRPYFVSALGFRNGWAFSPEKPRGCKTQDELLNKTFEVGEADYPWVSTMGDRSVTELEILHGCLNDPDLCPRTLVYFRDVEYLTKISKKERKTYAEIGWAEDKLFSLKKRIIEAGFPVKWFKTAAEMGKQLEDDLTASIEEDFPLSSVPDAIDREIRDHLTYVDKRTRVYIGGEHYLEQLDNYLVTGGTPYIIRGPSGTGKTSLTANWAKSIRAKIKAGKHKGLDIIQRHIGATENSTDPLSLVMLILHQIRRRFKLNDPMPNQDLELKDGRVFYKWLAEAGKKRPILVLIDSLDQLGTSDGDMKWLPFPLPPNVYLVCSCIDGKPADKELIRRNYRQINVTDLTQDSAAELMKTYLANYGKALDKTQMNVILSSEKAKNPLFLSVFLQEVRVFGSFEKLDDLIENYMSSENVEDLFFKVIQKIEKDYETVPKLVKYALSFFLTSSRGLTESEMKEAMAMAFRIEAKNTKNKTVEYNLDFASLMVRLDDWLCNQGALKSFAHNYIRAAIRRKYFSDPTWSFECHHLLSLSFDNARNKQGPTKRTMEELPFHHTEMLDMFKSTEGRLQLQFQKIRGKNSSELATDLRDVIVDVEMFKLFSESPGSLRDLHKCWSAYEKESPQTVVADSYAGSLADFKKKNKKLPDKDLAELMLSMGKFLRDYGRYRNTNEFFEKALELKRSLATTTSEELGDLLLNQGTLYSQTGKIQQAIDNYVECEALIESDLTKAQVRSLIADCMKELGQHEKAMVVYEQALVARKAISGSTSTYVAETQVNMAELCLRMGQIPKAELLLESAKDIYTEQRGYDSVEVALILSSLGSCSKKQGNFASALEKFNEAKDMKERLLGKGDLSIAKVQNNIADIYCSQGQSDKAVALLEQVLVARQRAYGENKAMVVPTLANLALVYRKSKQYPKAKELCEEVVTYYDSFETVNGVISGVEIDTIATAYSRLYHVLMETGQHDKALDVMNRALSKVFAYHLVVKQQHTLLAEIFHNLSQIHSKKENTIKALYWAKRSTAEMSHGHNSDQLAQYLMALSVIYQEFGSVEKDKEAVGVLKQALEVRQAVFGLTHSKTQEVASWLAEVEEDLAEALEEDYEDEDEDLPEMDAKEESDVEKAVRAKLKSKSKRLRVSSSHMLLSGAMGTDEEKQRRGRASGVLSPISRNRRKPSVVPDFKLPGEITITAVKGLKLPGRVQVTAEIRAVDGKSLGSGIKCSFSTEDGAGNELNEKIIFPNAEWISVHVTGQDATSLGANKLIEVQSLKDASGTVWLSLEDGHGKPTGGEIGVSMGT